MSQPIVKPVADPLDDLDRSAPVDNLMRRQDRADLPGNRSDGPPSNPDETAPAGAADVDVAIEDVLDIPARGPDDDEPIEETERQGDDSRTG